MGDVFGCDECVELVFLSVLKVDDLVADGLHVLHVFGGAVDEEGGRGAGPATGQGHDPVAGIGATSRDGIPGGSVDEEAGFWGGVFGDPLQGWPVRCFDENGFIVDDVAQFPGTPECPYTNHDHAAIAGQHTPVGKTDTFQAGEEHVVAAAYHDGQDDEHADAQDVIGDKPDIGEFNNHGVDHKQEATDNDAAIFALLPAPEDERSTDGGEDVADQPGVGSHCQQYAPANHEDSRFCASPEAPEGGEQGEGYQQVVLACPEESFMQQRKVARCDQAALRMFMAGQEDARDDDPYPGGNQ